MAKSINTDLPYFFIYVISKLSYNEVGSASRTEIRATAKGNKNQVNALERTAPLSCSHQPIYISPSLHVVQRSHDDVQSGVEGVAVDALSRWTHLVDMSLHLQVWVDITSGFGCCGTLWFLRDKKIERKGQSKVEEQTEETATSKSE